MERGECREIRHASQVPPLTFSQVKHILGVSAGTFVSSGSFKGRGWHPDSQVSGVRGTDRARPRFLWPIVSRADSKSRGSGSSGRRYGTS
jgi:hypothetical protein